MLNWTRLATADFTCSQPTETVDSKPTTRMRTNMRTDELPASSHSGKTINPASSANSSDANKNDPIATRQIKLFTVLLGVDTRLEAIRTAAPEFKVTAHWIAYKGDFPTKVSSRKVFSHRHIRVFLLSDAGDQDILKKKRFDLTPGSRLARAHFKKLRRWGRHQENTRTSLCLGKDSFGYRTTLTTPLCARIALMRKCFKLYPAENFWDKLDGRLASIQCLKALLEADRSAHGVRDEYDLPDDAVVDERQNEVDTVVERVV
ncbi:hypothetical protein B0H11DRAFT_1935310 [Mycena galericulata]|nr:hypothetical protein B0H11DRAFT_1935310 [Mycena galericulata]